MSQASQKGRSGNSLTLSNAVKSSAKTKSERTSIDETELNQKAKDAKEATKVINEEKPSTKKEKTPAVAEVAKSDKNSSKNDDKLKNGSSNNNSEDAANSKISNGSHKTEESASAIEERKTRETRQKAAALMKDNKVDSAETANANDSKIEKVEKSAEKPTVAIKDKEKDKETTKSNQKDKEKDKDTPKLNQKDKKQDKEEKTLIVKDTPKKETKDAKSLSLTSPTAAPKEKDTKDVAKPINNDIDKSKSKPDSTPSKSKKVEEKPVEAPAPKEDKLKSISPVVWDNEEMEPLMMQVDIEEKTPLKKTVPASTSTPTPSSRILRMRSGPLERNASLLSSSPLLTIDDPRNNTSTCVNLSTLSNPHSPDKSYGAKVRSVSGRRPMLREMSYQNSYRDHARYNDSYSPRSIINESTSSGYLDQSQHSVNTSSFVARKRYNEDHIVEEIESTKRPRLDVSNLLTLVASPVTMLRNRLARARIQSSTPNTTSNINKDDIEIDTVTASCIDEPKDVEEAGSQDDILANDEDDDDEDMKEFPGSDNFTTAPDDDIEIHTDIQVKILKEENKPSSLYLPNAAIKKKWTCSIM